MAISAQQIYQNKYMILEGKYIPIYCMFLKIYVIHIAYKSTCFHIWKVVKCGNTRMSLLWSASFWGKTVGCLISVLPFGVSFLQTKFLQKFFKKLSTKYTYKKISHHFKYIYIKVSLNFVSAVLQIPLWFICLLFGLKLDCCLS